MSAANVYATEEVYTIEDLRLDSAGDLVSICSIESGHEDHTIGLAFCYGFFEGAIRYAQAVSDASDHKLLICAPEGTTRSDAVEVFVTYMAGNLQFSEERPIDAIYRALIPRWPCAD